MIEKTYYTRDGHPFIQTTVSNPVKTLSVSNPMQVGDIEITESQYNTLISDIEQEAADAKAAIAEVANQREINKQSARAKLMGLGLTEAEVNSL